MAIEVPPRIVVSRYFRETASAYAAFAEGIRQSVLELRHGYRDKPPQKRCEDLSAKLDELGAFAASTSHTPAKAGAGFLEKYEASGYVLKPVTLVQVSEGKPYEEACLSLERASGTFKRKKAEVALSPLAILITKHSLLRLCERATVRHDEMQRFVAEQAQALVERLAVAAAFDLAIVEESDVGLIITSAVPWQNGLAVVTYRVVHCAPEDFDLGFLVRIPSGGMQLPYVNRAHLGKAGPNAMFASIGKSQPAVFACVTTYLGASDLTEDQAEYRAQFRAFMELVGAELAGALGKDTATGTPLHGSGAKAFTVDDPQVHRKARQLEEILERGWLGGGYRWPHALMGEYKA